MPPVKLVQVRSLYFSTDLPHARPRTRQPSAFAQSERSFARAVRHLWQEHKSTRPPAATARQAMGFMR